MSVILAWLARVLTSLSLYDDGGLPPPGPLPK